MSVAVIPGDPPIEVHLRRSARARRISLKVGRVDGRVTLSMPARGSLDEALAFAKGHEGWIRNALPKRDLDDLVPRIGGAIPFLGTETLLASGVKRGVVFRDGVLTVGGPPERLGAALAGFLKVEAQARLLEASERHAGAAGLRFTSMALRDTRSRWGSCSPDGRLMYSWRLVMAPFEVLDYVAAHEVAHLAEMNHGPRFCAMVRSLCPDYSRRRDWLKREGTRLQAIDFGTRA